MEISAISASMCDFVLHKFLKDVIMKDERIHALYSGAGPLSPDGGGEEE